MKPNQAARDILNSVSYITVATITQDGQPWNTPVASFHFDKEYILYWASWQDNQHSKNIRANGKVFIVVYDSTPADGKPTQGVYIQAEATELGDTSEVMRVALVFKDDPYNPSDGAQYLGDYPRRIYMATPKRIWVNSDDSVAGNFIDTRVKAEEL
jgi:hypothetical protein